MDSDMLGPNIDLYPDKKVKKIYTVYIIWGRLDGPLSLS